MGFRPSWAIALPEVDTKDAERFLLPCALPLDCHVNIDPANIAPANIDLVAPAKARVLFEACHHLLLAMSKQGGVVNKLEASNLAFREG